MMLRVQRERMSGGYFPTAREYTVGYGLTRARLAPLRPTHAAICHPGPMNRGLEISADAADAASSLILDQVSAGVAVRMSRPLPPARRGARRRPAGAQRHRSTVAEARHERRDDLLVRRRRPASATGAARPAGARRSSSRDRSGCRHRGDAEVIDADGLVALPGLVDLHTHLREPGREDAETIATGTRPRRPRRLHRGAGHGQHQPGHRHRRGGRAHRSSSAAAHGPGRRAVPVGAVTKGLAGEELAELGLMARSRAPGAGLLRRRPLRRTTRG